MSKHIIGEETRHHLRKIIFDSDTPEGKGYDIMLILAIVASVTCVMLDSISSINLRYSQLLSTLEWFFTLLFTVDYIVRLLCAENPLKYARSVWGIIDILGVIPTYISLFSRVSRYLIAIRILRVLRVFRVLRLVSYVREATAIIDALKACRRKIAVFLLTVFTLVVFLGSLMYVIEGEKSGFTSIPRSIYWAIVTLTTVGYGDIKPITALGQTLAALLMILGYSIIVVPTGIVTAEMTGTAGNEPKTPVQKKPEADKDGQEKDSAPEDNKNEPIKSADDETEEKTEQAEPARIPDIIDLPCRRCNTIGHDRNANFCKYCGAKL